MGVPSYTHIPPAHVNPAEARSLTCVALIKIIIIIINIEKWQAITRFEQMGQWLIVLYKQTNKQRCNGLSWRLSWVFMHTYWPISSHGFWLGSPVFQAQRKNSLTKEPVQTLVYKMYWCNCFSFMTVYFFFHLGNHLLEFPVVLHEVRGNGCKISQEQACISFDTR